LKVKVMHLKSALRDAEDKMESLRDEGEDLRKEDTALISDDEDYMEQEGHNGDGLDDEEDEDRTFINEDLEDPEPLCTIEATPDDEEEDPEEPPFEDLTTILGDF
jgi:hypothetical protein